MTWATKSYQRDVQGTSHVRVKDKWKSVLTTFRRDDLMQLYDTMWNVRVHQNQMTELLHSPNHKKMHRENRGNVCNFQFVESLIYLLPTSQSISLVTRSRKSQFWPFQFTFDEFAAFCLFDQNQFWHNFRTFFWRSLVDKFISNCFCFENWILIGERTDIQRHVCSRLNVKLSMGMHAKCAQILRFHLTYSAVRSSQYPHINTWVLWLSSACWLMWIEFSWIVYLFIFSIFYLTVRFLFECGKATGDKQTIRTTMQTNVNDVQRRRKKAKMIAVWVARFSPMKITCGMLPCDRYTVKVNTYSSFNNLTQPKPLLLLLFRRFQNIFTARAHAHIPNCSIHNNSKNRRGAFCVRTQRRRWRRCNDMFCKWFLFLLECLGGVWCFLIGSGAERKSYHFLFGPSNERSSCDSHAHNSFFCCLYGCQL